MANKTVDFVLGIPPHVFRHVYNIGRKWMCSIMDAISLGGLAGALYPAKGRGDK